MTLIGLMEEIKGIKGIWWPAIQRLCMKEGRVGGHWGKLGQ